MLLKPATYNSLKDKRISFVMMMLIKHLPPMSCSMLQLAPPAASYNDCIHPLLDAVDKLRNIMVVKEVYSFLPFLWLEISPRGSLAFLNR